MRRAWTAARLDDLNHKVDEMSCEMRAEFRAVRGEIKSMQTTMIGGFASVLATLIATQL